MNYDGVHYFQNFVQERINAHIVANSKVGHMQLPLNIEKDNYQWGGEGEEEVTVPP